MKKNVLHIIFRLRLRRRSLRRTNVRLSRFSLLRLNLKQITFFFILMSTQAWATPEKVEIVFLSEPKTAFALPAPIQFLGMVAQNDWDKECIPSGDGCFHPQLGYVPNEGPKRPADAGPPVELRTFNSDIDLVECREGEYFDIFCGKAKKTKAKSAAVEIWVDTSSSLRKMDFSTEPNHCVRRSFVAGIQSACGHEKVHIQTYDTSIKSMATLDGLCQNYGTNDVARLIDWIKASNAKYLFIITDIDELSRELRDFLDSIGAIYHGGDVKDVTVKDLERYTSVVKKHCA